MITNRRFTRKEKKRSLMDEKAFDPYDPYDEPSIREAIKDDDKIVFIDGKQRFIYYVSQLKKIIKEKQFFYGCKKALSTFIIYKQNVFIDKPYILLAHQHKYLVNLDDIKLAISSKNRIFILTESKRINGSKIRFPIASHHVIQELNRDINVVGATHCQPDIFTVYNLHVAKNTDKTSVIMANSLQRKTKKRNSAFSKKVKSVTRSLERSIGNKIGNKIGKQVEEYKLIDSIEEIGIENHYDALSSNTHNKAIEILLQNPEKINWEAFSGNSNSKAVNYLIEHPAKINWEGLSGNTHPIACKYFLEHKDTAGINWETFNWEKISANPNEDILRFVKENPDKINNEGYSRNPNPIVVNEYVLGTGRNAFVPLEFSKNPNDAAVDYLLKNQKKIENSFWENPNPNAVEFILKKKLFHDEHFRIEFLSKNKNKEAFNYFMYISFKHKGQFMKEKYILKNENQLIVNLILKNPDIIKDEFSKNPNDAAVDYLLNNPEKINIQFFSENPNPKAVNYILQHHTRYIDKSFSLNPNTDAVNYLLQNPDKIDWSKFSQNLNPIAVNYLLDEKEFLIDKPEFCKIPNERVVDYILGNNLMYSGFSENSHPKAVDYLLKNPTKINWNNFSKNSNPDAVKFMMRDENRNKVKNDIAFNKNKEAVEFGIRLFKDSVLHKNVFNAKILSNEHAANYIINLDFVNKYIDNLMSNPNIFLKVGKTIEKYEIGSNKSSEIGNNNNSDFGSDFGSDFSNDFGSDRDG